MENTYDQSIHRIREIEPDILLKIKEAREKKESAIAIKELQQKAGLATADSKDKTKGRFERNRDKNRSGSKADGPKDGNGYYKYGNCGKTHKGVCRKLKKTTDQNTTPRKDWRERNGKRPNAATRNYIKQMISSDSKKNRKGKGKRRYSSDSSSSDSSCDEPWRRGMSGAEQMHMLASAGINPSDSDIEFASDDERKYRKQAKKWSKSKKSKRRRR